MTEFQRIGIIGAMEIEVEALKRTMTEKTVYNISGIEFVDGRLDGRQVVVAKCGIGKVFAALCAQTMILKFRVEALINTGVAGTLSDKLGIGDVAVSTACVQHDMDTSPLGDPVGLISGINIVEIKADKRILRDIGEACARLGINSVEGVIASGDAFICDKEKKDYIKDTFGAIACEMEGAAIAQVCYVNNVPFAVIRAISDNADGSADISYEEFSAKAAENSVKVTRMVVAK
ncbi:MAG: 5'-methylthioadenosine/adenosylhomocysteine nucleosidase [Ruminococcaceae bacterium]|nr:5'-methylthioadenosine/adenosylhomocysteine nucleosidase [Oscillospiraceae bacterium]